ncbi:MAG: glycosyltransferase [Oscillospiraceae bacterium]|jgi:glycosyltransferase involved in cell wall biosynthesis|nr:glycosyltransferase [Oscillospiraceae bacterium]
MDNAQFNTLYIVIPCYNEEEALPKTAEVVLTKLRALEGAGRVSPQSRIMLVDDGSRDRTWETIAGLCDGSEYFAGVKLSRNRGHQNALLAGLMTARNHADLTISMDADLQDDIDAIDKMVEHYLAGADVVYGVRSKRAEDTFFKRMTAEGYYKVLAKLGCQVVFNHADYRLLSRRALDALAEYGEQSLFLRGIVPMLGYKTATVEYERHARELGESKYPLSKMLSLAADGVMGLSLKPVRYVLTAGLITLLLSGAFLVFALLGLIWGYPFLGWKLIVFSIWFVGGLLLTSLGVVGEYAGRAYMESKHRPRYFIERTEGLSAAPETEDNA